VIVVEFHTSNDEVPSGPDVELDAVLRRARPRPDATWVRETQRRLLPGMAETSRRSWWRLRPVAIGAVCSLTLVVTALAFVGGGPLGHGGGDEARATQECRTVFVTKVEPIGEVRRGADGSVEVQTVHRPVSRQRVTCRSASR
jgi:hypothetical protein